MTRGSTVQMRDQVNSNVDDKLEAYFQNLSKRAQTISASFRPRCEWCSDLSRQRATLHWSPQGLPCPAAPEQDSSRTRPSSSPAAWLEATTRALRFVHSVPGPFSHSHDSTRPRAISSQAGLLSRLACVSSCCQPSRDVRHYPCSLQMEGNSERWDTEKSKGKRNLPEMLTDSLNARATGASNSITSF